ncbi:hypothetical protein ALC62_13253, partial [Cyphomyrmex costatus]
GGDAIVISGRLPPCGPTKPRLDADAGVILSTVLLSPLLLCGALYIYVTLSSHTELTNVVLRVNQGPGEIRKRVGRERVGRRESFYDGALNERWLSTINRSAVTCIGASTRAAPRDLGAERLINAPYDELAPGLSDSHSTRRLPVIYRPDSRVCIQAPAASSGFSVISRHRYDLVPRSV